MHTLFASTFAAVYALKPPYSTCGGFSKGGGGGGGKSPPPSPLYESLNTYAVSTALAMVQLAIFLQSCLKLGYSEACAIHLGRIMSAYKFVFYLLVFGL